MEYLRRNFEAVQKQAADAASRAALLAQHARENATVLAQQASSNAKVLAQQVSVATKELAVQASSNAKATTEEARQRLQKLGIGPQQDSQGAALNRRMELVKYGITDEFIDFLRGLTYSTFRDYGSEELVELEGDGSEENFRLNPWQERHANLVLQVVKELQDLRYVLCPRRMSEMRFWRVYFTLTAKHLPENAFSNDPCEDDGDEFSGEMVESLESKPLLDGQSKQGKQHQGKPDQGGQRKEIGQGGGSGSGDFSSDAELEAYLDNVLKEDTDGADGEGSHEFEDIDEYLNQLNNETDGDTDAVEIASADLESYNSGTTPDKHS